jgi:enediyne biosynthesis protein E4
MKQLSYFIAFSLLFFSCGQKEDDKIKLFELLQNTGIVFNNSVQDTDSINILNYRNFYNGGGAAIGDINNDNLPDVFFSANQSSNKLFLNKGQWRFEDISLKAGFSYEGRFSTGVVMADINADGWLDIYVSNAGNMHDSLLRRNQLFINNHDLTFTDKAAEYGLANNGYTTQVSFFDYDADGDLDCFMIDNSPIPVNSLGYPNQRNLPAREWKVDKHLKGGGDHLYRNDNGYFYEITREAGIHGSLMSFGLGVTVGDVNGDHYPDIYVSNDFFERDYLYINQQNGTFVDKLESSIQHNSYASMGADFGDINNDGLTDIFTTDMLPADDYRLKTTLSFDDIDQYRLKERNGFYHQFLQNTLQLNNGNGKFQDIANYSGVNASEWSWGALMFDADNDGLIDLYVCNGIYRDLTNQDFLSFDANEAKEIMLATGKKDLMDLVNKIPSIAVPNKMYRNLGNLKFSDEGMNWGFSMNSFSNGAAYGDLDNDGDLDMVVNNVNEPAFVFKNNATTIKGNNYLKISLRGNKKNTFAVGAKVLAYKGTEVFSRELIPSRGFQSSVDYNLVIGIGNKKNIDSLIIIWPNLNFTKIDSPEINKALFYVMPDSGTRISAQEEKKIRPVFQLQNNYFDKHADDDYTDFYNERGVPQMLSREGPRAAVADVNADGLEDVFIGGTLSHPGQLYLQTPDGGFTKKDISTLNGIRGFVDAAVLFFDCDGDSDMDLLVCSGGNVAASASRELQHRLFLNDGNGNFKLSPGAFPLNRDNSGAALAFDFDKDNDLDLFIGARCVTGMYGMTPRSHVYINNGKGLFSEMVKEKITGISDAGMITDAVWKDLDNDHNNELIIVGEWMTPRIFNYQQGSFKEYKTNFIDKYGWWQAVEATDINNDGRIDLILGNLGKNFYLNPDEEHPIKIWINDFDNNGSIDKIVTRTIDGIDKPVFMKSELENQLPGLKKQNLRHRTYAVKSVQELVGKDMVDKSMLKQINYPYSCVAINKGKGNFEILALPVEAQLSSVKAILALDIDKDGKNEWVTGGNEFTFQPQFGRLDASYGELWIADTNRGLNIFSNKASGLYLRQQVRDIVLVKGKKRHYMLCLINNDFPALYAIDGINSLKPFHK